jgi:phosphoribosylformylglycinamidine synthase
LTRFRLEVRVTPRPGLLDPEGKAIHHTLKALGWEGVDDVRVGRAIYVDLAAETADAAVEAGEAMCRKILANPVTEEFEVVVLTQTEGVEA